MVPTRQLSGLLGMRFVESSAVKKKLIVSSSIVLVLWIGLVAMNLFSSPNHKLGLTDGKLAACPDSPNCVSSYATDEAHSIAPVDVTGKVPQEVMAAVKKALSEMPRTAIVSEDTNYIHATATTLLMRYVDDVEIYLDEAESKLHLRSASRIGYSDLGANRARVEKLKKVLAQHLQG